MPTLTLRKHSRGINRSVAPFEIEDGQYRTLRNLWPGEEALEPRPGQVAHLAQIGTEPVSGLARYYSGPVTGAPAGANSPTVAEGDGAFGTEAWANPNNAKLSDEQYATAQGTSSGEVVYSQYLKLTGLGFAIPAGSAVLGIKVEAKRAAGFIGDSGAAGGCEVKDARVRLVKGGVVGSTDRADTTTKWSSTTPGGGFLEADPGSTPPAAPTYKEYGGASDLWGDTWTPAEINASNFGVVIAVSLKGASYTHYLPGEYETVSAAPVARVDHVRLRIYYQGQASAVRETVVHVGTNIYSDRSGSWATINGSNPLSKVGRMEVAVWKGKAYIQDGVTGPWKYDGQTGNFVHWTAGSNAPPIAKFLLLDAGGVAERLYAAYLAGKPTAVACCHLDDADKWEAVAKPSGDEGVLMFTGQDDGDYITGLRRFSTWKMILKKQSIWRLMGDDADTWDLQQLFPVGCAGHRLAWDCGGAFVWTDGRKVYSFDGNRLNPDFGREVEPLLEETSIDDWASLTAVFWRSLYILWYRPDECVAYDFRSGGWYGPWTGIPCNVAVVDRDSNLVYFGSSQVGAVAVLDGEDDYGRAIAWSAETKHYSDFSSGRYDAGAGWVKRSRRLGVIADGGIGTVNIGVVADGVVAQFRRLNFSGTKIQRLTTPLRQGPDGTALGLLVEGTGQGKIYEMMLVADRLRRV